MLGMIILLVATLPCLLGVVGFALRRKFGIKIYSVYWISVAVISLISFSLTDDLEFAFVVTFFYVGALSISMRIIPLNAGLFMAGLVSFVASTVVSALMPFIAFSMSGCCV